MPDQGLLDEINNSFYGGGQAPVPSPTPTATPGGSWFSRMFGGGSKPTPSPTPTPNQFSMTDRMNEALTQAVKFDALPLVNSIDPLSAAIRSPYRFKGLPYNSTGNSGGNQTGIFGMAEVPPSLQYRVPRLEDINLASAPARARLQYPVMRWTSPAQQEIPGIVSGNQFSF